jgi:hypothetical protein
VSCLPYPLLPSAESTSPVLPPGSSKTSSSGLSSKGNTFLSQQVQNAEEMQTALPLLISSHNNRPGFASASSAPNSPSSAIDPDGLLDLFRLKLARQVPFVSLPK